MYIVLEENERIAMIDKNELLKLLPKLIREDDEIKGAIITALSGVVATKDDIARIIENFNRRFEEANKRFEAMDKRFETMQESMDKRFEAVDKRFETMQESMDKRFETVDKRFEQAAKEREDIKDSMLILREIVGELLQKTATMEKDIKNLEKDIKEGNEEILGYLRHHFEDE
ncbi:MAG: hypothetical protein BAJALOKI1v1_2150006 [Promethearchaeota archaeon]|nr:MAG: hypothetical protein BAJALOKI1v1_2150006 [Candidatus Lokiarchaeota archaeon]